ncbi:MAG: ketoacyl-ACP synthase III [Candidatus Margulisiibacteriota bacterium]
MASGNAKIIGTGSYVPEIVVESAELEKKYGLRPNQIVEMTGVKSRHFANADQSSSDLALEAAKQAIAAAKIDPKEIDLIIFGSSIGDQAIPTTASRLQKKLGLKNTAAFDVNYTCLSFLLAMDIAKNYISIGKYKNILIAAAELTSKVINWREGESRFLLGDGAGSVVVSRADEGDKSAINSAYFKTDSTHDHLIHIEGYGNRNHPNKAGLEPETNMFYMNGSPVLKQAMRGMDDLIAGTMKYADFAKNEIDYLIPHQASIFGISGGARKVGIDMAKALMTLAECGNTAAASMPLTLDRFVRNGTIKRGDKLIFLGTAAGLSWGGLTIVY